MHSSEPRTDSSKVDKTPACQNRDDIQEDSQFRGPLASITSSASKSTGVKSNPSLKATTQDSTPDWNGYPLIIRRFDRKLESGSVPLMDPDPSTLARQSQSAGPLRRPKTSPTTQLPPVTPNPVPTAVQSLTPPRSQNPVSVTAKASTESARRSSRRTASTQMTGISWELILVV